jgi:hypothetical protein
MSMLSALNRFQPLLTALNSNVESEKSITKELNYIEKNTALNINKKMGVLENDVCDFRQSEIDLNIGGSHFAENVESAVDQDKKVSTDDESRFKQDGLKRLKAVENVESGQPLITEVYTSSFHRFHQLLPSFHHQW